MLKKEKIVNEDEKKSAEEMAKLVSELSRDDKNIILGIVKGLLISNEIKDKNKICEG